MRFSSQAIHQVGECCGRLFVSADRLEECELLVLVWLHEGSPLAVDQYGVGR